VLLPREPPRRESQRWFDFLFALLASRHLASWGVEPSCSYLANLRDAKVNRWFDFLFTLLQATPSCPPRRTSRAPPDGCTTCSHEPRLSALRDFYGRKWPLPTSEPPNSSVLISPRVLIQRSSRSWIQRFRFSSSRFALRDFMG
jgi:hypothetical protein